MYRHVTYVAAARYDITIEQGSTFTRQIIWEDSEGNAVDLTGATAKAQIRDTYESPTAALTFTTEIVPGEGKVTITATSSQTASYSNRRAVWDLNIIQPNGNATRLLQGEVHISPQVSR